MTAPTSGSRNLEMRQWLAASVPQKYVAVQAMRVAWLDDFSHTQRDATLPQVRGAIKLKINMAGRTEDAELQELFLSQSIVVLASMLITSDIGHIRGSAFMTS